MRKFWLAAAAIFVLLTGCASTESTDQATGDEWLIALNADITSETIDGKSYLLLESPADTRMFTERPARATVPVTPQTIVAMWPVFGFRDVPPNAALLIPGQSPTIVTLNNPAWTVNDDIRIEVVDGPALDISAAGSIVIDGTDVVNGQVTDSVTQANVKVLGSDTAEAVGTLYQSGATSIQLAAQNAAFLQTESSIPAEEQTAATAAAVLAITNNQGVPGAQTPTS